MLAARARFAAAVALTCAATGSVAMPTVGSIWTCHVDERKVGFNFLNASSGGAPGLHSAANATLS